MHALHESELREHMQSYLTPDLDRTITNIFEFKIDRAPSSDEECNVLCLIEEAAETISEVDPLCGGKTGVGQLTCEASG